MALVVYLLLRRAHAPRVDDEDEELSPAGGSRSEGARCSSVASGRSGSGARRRSSHGGWRASGRPAFARLRAEDDVESGLGAPPTRAAGASRSQLYPGLGVQSPPHDGERRSSDGSSGSDRTVIDEIDLAHAGEQSFQKLDQRLQDVVFSPSSLARKACVVPPSVDRHQSLSAERSSSEAPRTRIVVPSPEAGATSLRSPPLTTIVAVPSAPRPLGPSPARPRLAERNSCFAVIGGADDRVGVNTEDDAAIMAEISGLLYKCVGPRPLDQDALLTVRHLQPPSRRWSDSVLAPLDPPKLPFADAFDDVDDVLPLARRPARATPRSARSVAQPKLTSAGSTTTARGLLAASNHRLLKRYDLRDD